jgi:putative ABC transport system permease protein
MLLSVFQELRFAGRALAKRRGYAAAAAFTLALGIGANVAIFSVVNAVLLRPLPYPESDRIMSIRHHAPGINLPELQSSPGLIDLYRASSRTLTHVAGYEMRQANLTGSGRPERVRTLAVTPEFFDALALRPALGRAFAESDAQQNSPVVGILTHALWQTRFGADPAIVGRQAQVDGKPMEVVGVMPSYFSFPDPEARLLVPLWLDPARGFGTFGTRTIARLAGTESVGGARQEVIAIQRQIPVRFPDLRQETLDRFGWSVTLEPLRERIVRDVATPLWILLGSVGFVLLIAGANVANLLLVRAESRRREVAVRAALGGSRARIAVTFLAESLLLAGAGGVLGWFLAAVGIRTLVTFGPPQLPRLNEITVDLTTIAFAAILSLAAGLAIGAVPLSGLARRSFSQVLRDGGRSMTAGRQQHRLRRLLIVGQVAMALVLLIGSGLMLRSVARLAAVDPGFRPRGLLTAGVSIGGQADRSRTTTAYRRILDEIASLPGVTAVGASNSLPIEGTGMNGSSFAIESRPRADQDIPPVTMYSVVSAGYFETLGIPVVAGRAPSPDDGVPGRANVWVNQSFVRRFLDGRAIGERIRIENNWLEIVGVVGDVRTFGLREDVRPMAYLPVGTPVRAVALDVMQVVVRTTVPPSTLASALRAAVDRVDPSVPVMRIRTMDEIISGSLARIAFTMTLLVIAAVVALVLGLVGLYSVISYIVGQRTPEIGVRLALGAQPGDVRAMVLRQGLGVALVGVVLGLGLAAIATRVMGSLLFEVSTHDPLTFAGATLALTAVSALATYLPARRAAAIDPLEAVRSET